MNFKELLEGAEPKMPGAPSGIQIMTPQQFVAKAGDMPGEKEVDEGVRDLGYDAQSLIMKLRRDVEERRLQPTREAVLAAARELAGDMDFAPELLVQQVLGKSVAEGWKGELAGGTVGGIAGNLAGSALGGPIGGIVGGAVGGAGGGIIGRELTKEEQLNELAPALAAGARLVIAMAPKIAQVLKSTGKVTAKATAPVAKSGAEIAAKNADKIGIGLGAYEIGSSAADIAKAITAKVGTALEEKTIMELAQVAFKFAIPAGIVLAILYGGKKVIDSLFSDSGAQQGVAESEDQLNRIRKLSGLEEATKLPASSREFGGDEFQDYMKRIIGTPDVDKQGNVKTDKKGNEKYVSGKTKTDRYKMPYIHRSSVVEYLGPDGQTYNEDKIKQALAQRPKALLKQNEKMKHSNGELEQFFNVGFAALTGIALDEDTNKLIIVNTCPGAGSCKIDCFAMKGGKVQFKAAWQSDGRILTYLLNDPDGFFSQLSSEITKEEKLGQKGGYTVTIRWHDAGDFFSPEYLDLALKMAAKHPDTKFYAYTKMAGAALGQKPPNFIINWSEGANTGQEKQVKAKDANLDTTKNSRIVPDDLFQDLLVKDEKKNLVKGSSGQWQVQPDKLPELKNRLAKEYGLSSNSILSYDEYMAKRKSIPAGMKYNVIVAPGEGDISANDPNIISTLLLKH
jgi:hypothetical protein